MILDAHCHAWTRWPYRPAVPDPGRGSAANLLWEMERNGVGRAVVICAGIDGNPDNAADVAAEAARSDGRLVPFADFDCRWHETHHAPGAPGRLAALLDRFPGLRGVTHYLDEDAPAGWLLSEEGLACLALLERTGLVLSLATGPAQAEAVAEAAARVPRLPILVHHLWRVPAGDEAALARVARVATGRPNLFLKLSGFGYAVAEGWDFPLPGAQAVARALAAAFGPDRLLWGSDWPVCTRYMTHRQALEIVRRHGPALPPAAMEAVLGGTMARLLEGWRPDRGRPGA
ncbi:amidohydrolase [Roseomonas sp. OT10]|uniref:amidohydrolase family protein n=1 Tax=Roseomonas cutis TaxID=2897332 RepID=UPI001E3E52C3|nr:amidohydrolase family protein [Roseomonas sp. OT10]UFN48830.1 amidohydrolase [Roseomonas sp. OT10]